MAEVRAQSAAASTNDDHDTHLTIDIAGFADVKEKIEAGPAPSHIVLQCMQLTLNYGRTCQVRDGEIFRRRGSASGVCLPFRSYKC